MHLFDTHCHTELSACAEDVSLEMYQELATASDVCFAITDHSAHIFYPPGKAWAFWGDDARAIFGANYKQGLDQCAEYLEWLENGRRGNMLIGVELDVFADGTMVFDPDLLPRLDIIVGAVHGIRALSSELSDDKVAQEFIARTLALCDIGADTLAHPFREWAQKKREVPQSLVEWLVSTAREHSIALELNCHYQVPDCDRFMLRLCREAGVTVSIATDTHRAHEFGDFASHRLLLDEVGYAPSDWAELLLQPSEVTG